MEHPWSNYIYECEISMLENSPSQNDFVHFHVNIISIIGGSRLSAFTIAGEELARPLSFNILADNHPQYWL